MTALLGRLDDRIAQLSADLAYDSQGCFRAIEAWIRRTRAEAEWRDLADAPLFEDAELYEIDVLNGVDVVRTFMSLTAATQVYSSADQVTDFGSNHVREGVSGIN